MKSILKSLTRQEKKQHIKLFIIDFYLFILLPILATLLIII